MADKQIAFARRRECPRIPFAARAVVIQSNTAEVAVGTATELGQFGCFVQTSKPLPRRSRIHVEIDDGTSIFSGSGVIAYLTAEGMGIAFGLVEAKNYEILASWLSRAADTINK